MSTSQQVAGGESPDPEAFLAAFDAFAQAVRRARGAHSGVDLRGLTLSQYGLLQPLLESRSARVRELAQQAGISAPTATRLLDTLERRGLVLRLQVAEDRRGVSVTLTDAGRTLLERQHDWLRARERALWTQFAPAERQLVPGLLIQLAGLIDEIAAGPEL
jgi:MarR family transcriptional regulator, organic hydroperoxide resistance regulator